MWVLSSLTSSQWLVSKSVDDYQQVPDCMRPTPTQVTMPHEMWIVLIPWPEVRDVLIRQGGNVVQLCDISVGFAALVTLDWSYSPADLIDHDPWTNVVTLNPLFERHVLTLENGSLQLQAIRQYPILAGHVRVAW
ncbi:hypothetical protein LTS09_017736 [Friedmanniomyces endolithicus]|nr:hypothetical protein LTS09_017736 [Friedmanniomyces endolithicus]